MENRLLRSKNKIIFSNVKWDKGGKWWNFYLEVWEARRVIVAELQCSLKSAGAAQAACLRSVWSPSAESGFTTQTSNLYFALRICTSGTCFLGLFTYWRLLWGSVGRISWSFEDPLLLARGWLMAISLNAAFFLCTQRAFTCGVLIFESSSLPTELNLFAFVSLSTWSYHCSNQTSAVTQMPTVFMLKDYSIPGAVPSSLSQLRWKPHSNWNSSIIFVLSILPHLPQSNLNSGASPGLKLQEDKWGH